MPEDLVVDAYLTLPAAELQLSACRSSGPGGQHVNKSDTKIELRWNLLASAAVDEHRRRRLLEALAGRLTATGELILTCDTHRSQRRNREEVRRRLADLLRRALRPRRPRVPTRATAASRQRRRRQKQQRARLKESRRTPAGDD